jgi:hypothetical protein
MVLLVVGASAKRPVDYEIPPDAEKLSIRARKTTQHLPIGLLLIFLSLRI